jgi:Fe2+ transport system protein FeoA
VHDLVSLGQLATGQIALVAQVVGTPQQVRRFEELGIRPGVMVEMIQSGIPCIFRVSGSKLCFRQSSEVLSVLVHPSVAA